MKREVSQFVNSLKQTQGTTTGRRSPSAQTAVSGGGNNSFDTISIQVYGDDRLFAQDSSSGTPTNTVTLSPTAVFLSIGWLFRCIISRGK